MLKFLKSLLRPKLEKLIPTGQICTFKALGDDCSHMALYFMDGAYFCMCCADDAYCLDSDRTNWHDCQKLTAHKLTESHLKLLGT